jgi:5-methylcytosine-specific restriction endonuclease McrA
VAIRQATQDLVRRRANGLCEYCLCPESFATQPHSIEHILPRAQGGSDDPSNLALASLKLRIFKTPTRPRAGGYGFGD